MPTCITDSHTCQLVNQCRKRFFTVKNLYILVLPVYTSQSILGPIFKFQKCDLYPSIYGMALACVFV